MKFYGNLSNASAIRRANFKERSIELIFVSQLAAKAYLDDESFLMILYSGITNSDSQKKMENGQQQKLKVVLSLSSHFLTCNNVISKWITGKVS